MSVRKCYVIYPSLGVQPYATASLHVPQKFSKIVLNPGVKYSCDVFVFIFAMSHLYKSFEVIIPIYYNLKKRVQNSKLEKVFQTFASLKTS